MTRYACIKPLEIIFVGGEDRGGGGWFVMQSGVAIEFCFVQVWLVRLGRS